MMTGHSKGDAIEGIMKDEREVPIEDEVNLKFEMVAHVPEAYHFEGLMHTCFLVLKLYDLPFLRHLYICWLHFINFI